jgi:hypothetical protein
VQLGLLWWTVDLFTTAHPHAERALAELRHHLDSEDHLAIGSITAAMDVMLTIRRGRLTDAEAMAAACAERAAATADASAAARFAAHLAAIRWYQGRLTAVLPRLSQLVHSPLLAATDDSLLAVLATATAMAGDRPRAASMLARLRGANLADLPRSATWLATLYGVAEVADLLDDADAAGEVYHLLAPFAHLPVMGHWAVICLGSVQHALGVAALTMRDPHRAVAHLHAAVRDNLALGHLPATALSRARLAQALVLRHGPDTDAARRQRVQAAGEAAAMGMTLPQDHDAHRVTPPHL